MYDGIGAFLPWRLFAARSLGAGTVPLWNPYQFCGAPFVANVQSAVFYPGMLLGVFLGPVAAAGILVLLHLVLAASFTWLLVRRLGAGAAGATVAGIVYAFSTWQVSWLHLPTFLATTCWFPLALLMTLRLFDSPSFGRTVGLGVVIDRLETRREEVHHQRRCSGPPCGLRIAQQIPRARGDVRRVEYLLPRLVLCPLQCRDDLRYALFERAIGGTEHLLVVFYEPNAAGCKAVA